MFAEMVWESAGLKRDTFATFDTMLEVRGNYDVASVGSFFLPFRIWLLPIP